MLKRQREAEQLRKTEKATKQTPQPPRNTFTGSDHVKPARVASGVRKQGLLKLPRQYVQLRRFEKDNIAVYYRNEEGYLVFVNNLNPFRRI